MGRKYIRCVLGGLAVLALASVSAQAAILNSFNTTDSAPPNDDGFDAAAVTVTTFVDATSTVTDGTTLAAGGVGLNRLWNSEWAGFTLSSANGVSLDNAAEFGTGYFTFTVSATAGKVLNLSSLTFNAARGGGTDQRGYEIYATVNGGAFNFGDAAIQDVDLASTVTRTAPLPTTVDLSAAKFQGIDSVTFRYYPMTPATGNSDDFSAMTLNGVTAVPEPTTAGAVLVGGLLAAGLRRRRRSAAPAD